MNSTKFKSPQIAALYGHVGGLVGRLQSDYLNDYGAATSAARATLARLRRMDPLEPGSDIELLGVILDHLDESLVGHGDEPSHGESAASIAIHLYSRHQQGRSRPMHDPEARFGHAVRRLARILGDGERLSPGVLVRFTYLGRPSSRGMRVMHLRTLVDLLRGEDIALNYGQLAVDLFRIQDARTANATYLNWARDFHTRPSDEPKPSKSDEQE